MKIAIVLGTHPEIIKMSPIIRACDHHNTDYYILHTDQHYSYAMGSVFFEELNLPAVRYNLDVGSGTHGRQTATMLESMGYLELLQLERGARLVLSDSGGGLQEEVCILGVGWRDIAG